MELAPSGTLSFEVTFDRSDLSVGMLVYDVTGSPVLVSGPTLMPHLVNNTYVGSFVALGGKSYVVVKSVYTDGTLTVIDSNYSAGSESIIAESSLNGASSGGCSVIGVVIPNPTIIGIVRC